jgi:hypothetical protein
MRSREEKVKRGEGRERAKGRGKQGGRSEAVLANFFEQSAAARSYVVFCYALR